MYDPVMMKPFIELVHTNKNSIINKSICFLRDTGFPSGFWHVLGRECLCVQPLQSTLDTDSSEHAWQIFCLWREESIHPENLLAGTLGPVTSPLGPLPLLAWCCIRLRQQISSHMLRPVMPSHDYETWGCPGDSKLSWRPDKGT